MTRTEELIIKNKAIQEFIERIMVDDANEFENGQWRAVLEGRLDGVKRFIDILEGE